MSFPLTQCVHDVEEQLLKDLEDFQRVFERLQGEVKCTSLESLGITQTNGNPLLSNTEQEDVQTCAYKTSASWNNVGSQHVPYATDYNPILDMRMNTASRFPVNANQTCEQGYTFNVPPEKSISDPTGDLQLFSHLEQFIQKNSNAVVLEKKEEMAANCTRNNHQDIANKSPTKSCTFKKTVSSLEDSTGHLPGLQSQHTNKLFAIFSEMLRLLENPESAAHVASYIQILQKALNEMRNAVPFNVSLDDIHMGSFMIFHYRR